MAPLEPWEKVLVEPAETPEEVASVPTATAEPTNTPEPEPTATDTVTPPPTETAVPTSTPTELPPTPTPEPAVEDECLVCHMNQEQLIATAAQVEQMPSESSGVG